MLNQPIQNLNATNLIEAQSYEYPAAVTSWHMPQGSPTSSGKIEEIVIIIIIYSDDDELMPQDSNIEVIDIGSSSEEKHYSKTEQGGFWQKQS